MRSLVLAMTLPWGLVAQAPKGPVFDRVLPLKPEEGVFAYSRVSPDGQCMSYASETQEQGRYVRTVNIVELATRRILFSEPGMDSYWAPDGQHVIYLSLRGGGEPTVCIWNRRDGSVTRDVAPQGLGHYFSWAQTKGRDRILTQDNHYYDLVGGKAQRPYRKVPAFPPLGAGTQPMISKDGKLIATFHRGTVLVRALDEPEPRIETRLRGGKADFSYDGRYLAFHAAESGPGGDRYQIKVVDLQTREVLQVTDLPGSCYYPSWTRDGRLLFRYDAADYRGFMMASGVLQSPRSPLPAAYPGETQPESRLSVLLRGRPLPTQRLVVVNFWAGWCVHCRSELPILHQLRQDLRGRNLDAEILGACDPTSFRSDRDYILQRDKLDLPQIEITAQEVNAFGVQVYPTTLVFVDGQLVARHAGALTRAAAVALLQKHGLRGLPEKP